MKKLLALLGALGMTVSASTIVVACGTNSSIKRSSTAVLSDELRDKLIAGLKQDENLLNITQGKRFSDIDVQEALLRMVQDEISKLANEHFKDLTNDKFQLTKQGKVYENEMNEIASEIAQNQFYLQYTNNKLTNPATSLDEQLSIGEDNFYTLNPQDLLTNDNEQGEKRMDFNKYFVYMNETDSNGNPTTNWIRWQYARENNQEQKFLPTINELENNKFIILRNTTTHSLGREVNLDLNTDLKANLFYKKADDGTPVGGDDPEKYIYSTDDGNSVFEMNGKTALEYRFQEYFTTEQEKIIAQKDATSSTNFYELLLAMSYLDSNFYNVSGTNTTQSQQDAYLNVSSNLAQTVQSWSKTDGYQSKIKMVWSFTLKEENVRNAWSAIGNIVEGDGTLPPKQTLRSLYNILDGIQINDSNLGTDPFFNLNGYNGLVKTSDDGNSITSIDGNLMISESAKTKIAKTNKPAILTEDDRGQGFASGAEGKQNEFDFVLVLPVYLIDLLNDRTGEGYDYGQSTTAFAKIGDIKDAQNLPTKLYSSYAQTIPQNSLPNITESKAADIQEIRDQTANFYIYDGGVAYNVLDFNNTFGTEIHNDPTKIWTEVAGLADDLGVEGIQFTAVNTHDLTLGNIGVGQEVNLGTRNVPSKTEEGIEFRHDDSTGDLFVTATAAKVGQVVDFTDFKLSFDDASKDGVISIKGNTSNQNYEKQGKTYSYKINMGTNGSDPNGYIVDQNNDFHYYNKGISSWDISTLSTEKKTSLLREIEFVTAKETGVADTAAGAIFPLFLNSDQILYQPLYDKLKQYLIDDEGGTSD